MQSKVKKGGVKCEHWKRRRKKDAKRVWYYSINAAKRRNTKFIPPPFWHNFMHFATLSSVYCLLPTSVTTCTQISTHWIAFFSILECSNPTCLCSCGVVVLLVLF
jgi:hypothetical protein